jgi:serine phosphatase RsbU (regulator of sigma subunit)/TPR repeat protein
MNLIRKTIIAVAVFCFFLHVSGQKHKKDSLMTLIRTTTADTTRCNAYMEMGNLFKSSNVDSTLFYYNKALDLSAAKNLKKQQATSLRLIGVVYKNKSDFDKAMDYCEQSLKIFTELDDKKGISSCYMNYGNVYTDKGDYDKAIDYHFKSLNISEQMNDKLGMANSYNNIGSVYKNQGLYDKASDFYFKSLQLYEELKNEKGIALCNMNIGNVYKSTESFDKAIEYYTKSIENFQKLDDKSGLGQAYNNMAGIFSVRKDFNKAIDYYLKAVKLNEELGNKLYVSNSYNNLGKVYEKMGDFDNSISYYAKSLKIKEECGDKKGISMIYCNLADMYLNLAKSTKGTESVNYRKQSLEYANKALVLAKEINALPEVNAAAKLLMILNKMNGNYKEALEYADIFITSRDSMFNIEKTKTLANAESKFKLEKKQLEIDKLNKEKELQQSELLRQQETGRRQKLIIFFVITGLIIIGVFAGYIVQRLKIIRRQNAEISSQRDLVMKQKNRIEKQNLQITTSINYAKRIQQAVLPSGVYAKTILGEHFVLFKPKDIVSGDFYWATRIDKLLLLVVADCTGHGVPGAFMSMLGVSFLNEIVRKKEVNSASDVLEHLRDSVIVALQQKSTANEQKDGMDVAVCVLNTETNYLQYAGAHNPLYIINNKKELTIIKADRQPVAYSENMRPFTNHEIQLFKGDCIYLISDGFEDQFGGKDDRKFLIKKLKEELVRIADKPMNEQGAILNNAFESWKGEQEQTDDVTLLGLRI